MLKRKRESSPSNYDTSCLSSSLNVAPPMTSMAIITSVASASARKLPTTSSTSKAFNYPSNKSFPQLESSVPHPPSKPMLLITSPNPFSGPSTLNTSPTTHLGTQTSLRLNLLFAALKSQLTIVLTLLLPLPLPLKTCPYIQPMLNDVDVYKPQRRESSRQLEVILSPPTQ